MSSTPALQNAVLSLISFNSFHFTSFFFASNGPVDINGMKIAKKRKIKWTLLWRVESVSKGYPITIHNQWQNKNKSKSKCICVQMHNAGIDCNCVCVRQHNGFYSIEKHRQKYKNIVHSEYYYLVCDLVIHALIKFS